MSKETNKKTTGGSQVQPTDYGEKATGVNLSAFLDINKYKNNSTLSDNLGLPFVNRYICLLNAPSKTSGEFSNNGWLEMQVLSVDCPSLGVDFGEMEMDGVRRFYSKTTANDDLQITFLETPDLSLRRFFYAWLNLAVRTDNQGNSTRRLYQDQYTCKELKVAPLDFEGKAYYADRFLQTFPYKIQDINYNYGTSNEIIKTTVSFKYVFHDIVSMTNKDGYHFTVDKSRGVADVKSGLFNKT